MDREAKCSDTNDSQRTTELTSGLFLVVVTLQVLVGLQVRR